MVDISSIIGEVVGGLKVNILWRSPVCISVVLHRNISPLKPSRTFSPQSKSNLAFLKNIFFLSVILPLFIFFNSFSNELCTLSASCSVRLLSYKFFNNTAGRKYLLRLSLLLLLNNLDYLTVFLQFLLFYH